MKNQQERSKFDLKWNLRDKFLKEVMHEWNNVEDYRKIMKDILRIVK